MSVNFFATEADMRAALAHFETLASIKFVEAGTFTTPEPAIYREAKDLPDVGTATHETATISRGFIVLAADREVQPRERTLKNGGRLWDVRQTRYVDSVLLQMGGVWPATGAMLPGNMFTAYRDSKAGKALIKAFRSALRKKGFKKVKRYSVGPGAMNLLMAGRRFATLAIQSPADYDLKPPDGAGDTASAATIQQPIGERLTYTDSIARLRTRMHVDVREDQAPPERMPQPTDPEAKGLSFFRTRVESLQLVWLTLPRTFVSRSDILETAFCGSDLSESFLCWNDFHDVDFSDAVLAGADLRASNFRDVSFARAELTNADLRGARFSGCSFEDAVMVGTRMTKALGETLTLSPAQQDTIAWLDSDGEAPPGG
ncbi:MAG: pentapeptide repeat-containing protein [Myxococcota bacterium]